MFKQKNALISLAVVTLVAACGGGGGSGNDDPIAGGGGGTVIQPTVDAKLAGTLLLASDQVMFGSEALLPYADFVSDTPRPDDPATPGFDESGYGIFGQDRGVNAPLVAMGYRVSFSPTVPETALEPNRGRLAFELQDQASVTAQEILRIEIDQVDVSLSATNELTFAIPATAKLYVHAKNAAGQSATVTTVADASLIEKTPITGDASSAGLLFKVDMAVAAAVAAATGPDLVVMTSVKDFSSGKDLPFEIALTLSNVEMALGSAPATTPLVGKAITVDGAGVPGVTGGGVPKGFLRVDPVAP